MTNKVYQPQETAITWKSSGGTEVFTPTSLGAAAGRQGAYHDLGAGSVSRRFNYTGSFKPGATRVVGEVVEWYLLLGDGTYYSNDDGTGDIAVSAYDKLRNANERLNPTQIDENAAVPMTSIGTIEVSSRYVAPAVWNATANSLSATAGDFYFALIPVPDEIQ